MFGPDFYPTPEAVAAQMLEGYDLTGKIVLEPSAGKGDLVDYILQEGAERVLACEVNEDLRKVLETKCKIISEDFLGVTSDEVSHVDFIVMNPPFSEDDKHILHAFDIAPPGCHILALCNLSTLKNQHTATRRQLGQIVEENGRFEDLGDCFTMAERTTGVEVALIQVQKPGESYQSEFNGFFMEEDEEEQQENALMSYNVVRDLVNRYVEAVKLFDKQLELGVQMNTLTSGFYSAKMGMNLTADDKPTTRIEFKKELQKSGWMFIFKKMNLNKYATTGLKEDINSFVERQTEIPFTMKNIYRMLDTVIGTTQQRMDKALLEVFDKLTKHYDENRYNLEGWKTNSNYLINKKFIMPYVVDYDNRWPSDYIEVSWNTADRLEDMQKALCYLTGTNYDNCTPLRDFIDRQKCEFGKWYSWGFFEIKGFKKGTMHFKFNSDELWAQFNQRIAKIKGFPLYEHTNEQEKAKKQPTGEQKVLFEIAV